MGTIGSVWIVPLLATLFGICSVFIPYWLAVQNGHAPAILPFISDCGAFAPESCLFSQLFNMTAFFLIITLYLRHRQIVEYYGNRLRRHDLWWRKMSLSLLIMGIGGALCITATASFSITDNVLVHMLCAMTSFLLITVYIWGQVILSFALSPRMSPPLLNWTRLLIALIGTSALFLHEIGIFTKVFVPQGHSLPPLPIPYSPPFVDMDSPYWLRHIISTGAEWLMVISYLLFVLSMTFDLRYTYMRPPNVFFKKTHLPNLSDTEYLMDDTVTQLD